MNNRIKELREISGFTQQDMAIKVGMDIRTYQRIESGESDIMLARFKNVLGIAKSLGVKIEDLLKY